VSQRVLITGASGLIGGILRDALADRYELSGVDRRRGGGAESRVADMTKLRRVQPAFQGQDVVVDLAANPTVSSSWSEIYENNVPATANAYEAARRAGVKRVIYASSNHATGMYERDQPYAAIVAGEYEGLDPAKTPYVTSRDPVRPDGPYGVGKVLGEALGRYYADMFGLSVICLRIGTVNRENRPRNAREFSTLLTHADLVQLVDCCIRAPEEVRFAIYYGVSANTWRFWEIADAAEAIGYRPRDDAEAWR
jgi:nucleoside-diphosphate-sugar epimerase